MPYGHSLCMSAIYDHFKMSFRFKQVSQFVLLVIFYWPAALELVLCLNFEFIWCFMVLVFCQLAGVVSCNVNKSCVFQRMHLIQRTELQESILWHCWLYAWVMNIFISFYLYTYCRNCSHNSKILWNAFTTLTHQLGAEENGVGGQHR